MVLKTSNKIEINNNKFKLNDCIESLQVNQIFKVIGPNKSVNAQVTEINKQSAVFKLYDPKIDDFDLFVFDLDGTLLNHESEIFESSINTIKKLSQIGKKIILATGRPIYTGKKYAEETGLKTECVFSNGGMTYDLISDAITDLVGIPDGEAQEIYDFLTAKKYDFLIYSEKGITSFDAKRTNFIHQRNYSQILPNNYWVGESFRDLENHTVTKFLIILDDIETNTENLRLELNEFFKDKKDSYFLQSHPKFFDVMSKTASKGRSLKKLLDKWNIDPNRVISFGDADNDVSNFLITGYAIAMQNGSLKALENANDSVDNSKPTWLSNFIKEKLKASI